MHQDCVSINYADDNVFINGLSLFWSQDHLYTLSNYNVSKEFYSDRDSGIAYSVNDSESSAEVAVVTPSPAETAQKTLAESCTSTSATSRKIQRDQRFPQRPPTPSCASYEDHCEAWLRTHLPKPGTSRLTEMERITAQGIAAHRSRRYGGFMTIVLERHEVDNPKTLIQNTLRDIDYLGVTVLIPERTHRGVHKFEWPHLHLLVAVQPGTPEWIRLEAWVKNQNDRWGPSRAKLVPVDPAKGGVPGLVCYFIGDDNLNRWPGDPHCSRRLGRQARQPQEGQVRHADALPAREQPVHASEALPATTPAAGPSDDTPERSCESEDPIFIALMAEIEKREVLDEISRILDAELERLNPPVRPDAPANLLEAAPVETKHVMTNDEIARTLDRLLSGQDEVIAQPDQDQDSMIVEEMTGG
jgi:hypothetical protein